MATAINSSVLAESAATFAPLRLHWARSLEELDALEEAWRAMGGEVGHPLAQFIWTRASLAAFAENAVPYGVAAMRDARVVALAPLVRKRVRGIRRLCLAGVGELFEPMDFVWTDPQALDKLIRSLARRGSPLLLERLPADSLSLSALRRIYRARAIVVVRRQASCPYIALDESWLEPESHLNAGRRSDLRRARRKAEQLGPVTTEIHTPDLDELPQLLDSAFEVEALSWKGDARTALAHDAHRAVFYRRYAQAACMDGILRICFLRIGDRMAAMQLAVEQGGGFFLLKVGYDARFASCSPGMLLMRDTIRYAVEAGLSSYEFLGRSETWTEVWTKTERPYVSVRVYPLGLRGLAALASDAVGNAYSRWRKKK